MGRRKFEAAQADWPQEKVFEKEGRVQITGSYKDPELGERSYVRGTVFWALTVLLAWLFRPDGTFEFFFAAFYIGFAVCIVMAVIHYFHWRKRVDITIAPESIKVGRRHYDLKAVSEFRAQRHRKAVEALEKHGTPSRKHTEALEVVMQYGERVVPIADFRGRDQDKARALVIKLQNWVDGFKSLRKKGDAVPDTKDTAGGSDEFGPAPPIR